MFISRRPRTADGQAKGKSHLLASCLHVESLCPGRQTPCRFLPPCQAPSAAGGPELRPLQASSHGLWLEAPPSTSLPGNTWLPPPRGKLQTLRADEMPGADCPHREPPRRLPCSVSSLRGWGHRPVLPAKRNRPPGRGASSWRARPRRPSHEGPSQEHHLPAAPSSPLLRFPLRISKLRGHNAPLKAESPRFCDTTKPSCRLALSRAPSAK